MGSVGNATKSRKAAVVRDFPSRKVGRMAIA
jgi:hypothetical protein